jgi:hypothetical protein
MELSCLSAGSCSLCFPLPLALPLLNNSADRILGKSTTLTPRGKSCDSGVLRLYGISISA